MSIVTPDEEEGAPFIVRHSADSDGRGHQFILEEPPTGRDFLWPCMGLTVMLGLSILIVTADGGANDDDKGIEGKFIASPGLPAAAPTVSRPAPPAEKGAAAGVGVRKVFVMGMPKSGTSSIASYFSCGGVHHP